MLLEMLQAAVGGESRGKSEPKYETRKLKEIIKYSFLFNKTIIQRDTRRKREEEVCALR